METNVIHGKPFKDSYIEVDLTEEEIQEVKKGHYPSKAIYILGHKYILSIGYLGEIIRNENEKQKTGN